MNQQSSHPNETTRSEPVREPKSAKEITDDPEAGRIADASPEGIPADPETGSKRIIAMIILSIGAVVAAALIIGFTVGSGAGWGVLIVGIAIAAVINPVMYAAIARARERERLHVGEGVSGGNAAHRSADR